jgi:hypothetical protein
MKRMFFFVFIIIAGCVTDRFRVDYNKKIKFNPDGQIIIVQMRNDPINFTGSGSISSLLDDVDSRLRELLK